MTDQHRALVEDYKYVDGQRIHERGAVQFEINIQDDYVGYQVQKCIFRDQALVY